MGFKLKPGAAYPIQITYSYRFQIFKRKEKDQNPPALSIISFCLLFSPACLTQAPVCPALFLTLICLFPSFQHFSDVYRPSTYQMQTQQTRRGRKERDYMREGKNQQKIQHVSSLFNHFLLAGSHSSYCMLSV